MATDAALDRDGLPRPAGRARVELALAIRPVHGLLGGDVVFALSTGKVALGCPEVAIPPGTLAADCTARAVVRGVRAGERSGDVPCRRERAAEPPSAAAIRPVSGCRRGSIP
ncbi:MAG: P1 family peptidase [Geminicoccaceae bacterium]|nr:P1 family peptidase [Geminicoccaceae bacterium]